MNINIKNSVTGKYQIIKEGPEGCSIYNFHNIACMNFIKPNINGRYDTFYDTELYIGDGGGVPAVTDTALFNRKWVLHPTSNWAKIEKVDMKTARFTYTYIVPATSEYVGRITEVGMHAVVDNVIFTHAMISDAEGNPITIDKKIDDVLTINIVFEMHTSLPSFISDDIYHYVSEDRINFASIMLAKRFNARQLVELLDCYMPDHRYDVQCAADLRLGIRPCNAVLFSGDWYLDCDPIDGIGWEYGLHNMTMYNNNTLRLAAESKFNGHYYMYMQLMVRKNRDSAYACLPLYIDLRKSGIFPPQEITGIPLITGDGEKTTFILPFNYFQKDTDKVYKNGTQLYRGVDYTINNATNIAGLQEIMFITSSDSSKISITSKEDSTIDFSADPIQFFPDSLAAASSDTFKKIPKEHTARLFSHSCPLIIDWGEPRICNTLRGELRYQSKCYGAEGYDCVIEYANSLDGPWHEAARIPSMPDGAYLQIVNLSWQDIKAQYWRITPNCYRSDDVAYFLSSTDNDANGYPLQMFFGYSSDKGIIFTKAPAPTDKLTMDCKCDVLFKNNKFAFVMDADLSISYN